MEECDAMLYEAPFAHVLANVKPVRLTNNRKSRAEKWWRHGEARPAMRKALSGLGRYIATSEKSKHRFFVWLDERIAPDNRLVVIARNDDVTFGILSSRIHVCWALAVGSTLEDRPAYATTTCFDTFPFPGHWAVMFGQLVVTKDVEAYLKANPLTPAATPATHKH